ncbi:protein of unknown function [Burkholderia multivorans]
MRQARAAGATDEAGGADERRQGSHL